ncbi:MAG: hypothetical protein Q8Q04_02945 [archaeon]|nr:hypothetical protein [archaeon]
MGKITKYSLINALGTSAYIVAVAYLMSFLENIFDGKESVLSPIFMIMLFVFSAAFTGSLVFGRPVMWYLDGKKKEAIALLFRTLLIFFVITAIAFLLTFLII